MLLKHVFIGRELTADQTFSTLYRVDAIEAFSKRRGAVNVHPFSTLYRVDAIEARRPCCPSPSSERLSVPSIGSMLLKQPPRHDYRSFQMAFQYPLSGRCY